MNPDAAEATAYFNSLPPTVRRNALHILEHEDAVLKVDPDHWEILTIKAAWSRVKVYRRGDLIRCRSDRDNTQDNPCSHILVVMVYEGMTALPDTSGEVHRKSNRRRDHGLEARAWEATAEQVPVLLGRLIEAALPYIEEPPAPGQVGRPPARVHPLVYQGVMRVWQRQSLRRLRGTLNASEHMEHNPYGPVARTTLSRWLCQDSTTQVLEKVLALSTWPARPYERVAHPDGTGLTSQHFTAFHQEKHEKKKDRREHRWLYTVILWSYEYTLIAGLRAANGNFGEAEWAVPLMMRAGLMLDFKEFGGDKAYSTGYIFDYLSKNGIDGQVKFKDNATGKHVRGNKAPFKTALRRSRLDKYGYAARANRRSNAESGNHALKRVFGDTLSSRTTTAQRNELLCMSIAYNLARLVYMGLDRGIEIQFDTGADRLGEWVTLDGLKRRFFREYPAGKPR